MLTTFCNSSLHLHMLFHYNPASMPLTSFPFPYHSSYWHANIAMLYFFSHILLFFFFCCFVFLFLFCPRCSLFLGPLFLFCMSHPGQEMMMMRRAVRKGCPVAVTTSCISWLSSGRFSLPLCPPLSTGGAGPAFWSPSASLGSSLLSLATWLHTLAALLGWKTPSPLWSLLLWVHLCQVWTVLSNEMLLMLIYCGG